MSGSRSEETTALGLDALDDVVSLPTDATAGFLFKDNRKDNARYNRYAIAMALPTAAATAGKIHEEMRREVVIDSVTTTEAQSRESDAVSNLVACCLEPTQSHRMIE